MNREWSVTAKWGFFSVPKGWCAAVWTPTGLSTLVLPQKNRVTVFKKMREYLPKVAKSFWDKPNSPVPSNIRRQTILALRGKSFRFYKFDIRFLTSFQQRILRATCRIRRGEARTYGWVARKAGSPKGFRAAGQALTRNPVPIFIPCHRVIASGSKLGGYGSGIGWKIRLLKNEGVGVNRGLEGSYRVGKL